MFGRVQIVYDTRAEALTIPRSALAEEDGEAVVFVIERGIPIEVAPASEPRGRGRPKPKEEAGKPREATTIARRRLVTVGFTQGERVEVTDGLVDGDKVVTVGRAALRDGVAVQVLEAVE
jgi:membrane fusion protein (multidrug efflux system)